MKTSGLLIGIHPEEGLVEGGVLWEGLQGNLKDWGVEWKHSFEDSSEHTPEITYGWVNHSLAQPTKQEVSSWGCSLTFGVRFYKNKHQKEVLSVDKFKSQQRLKC